MAIVNIAELYSAFQTGDFPSEQDFKNLIDSSYNYFLPASAYPVNSEIVLPGDLIVSGGLSAVDTFTSLYKILSGNRDLAEIFFLKTLGESVHTSVLQNSGKWDQAYTATSANSAEWDSVYSTTQSNSAGWESVETSVRDASANWNSNYTSSRTTSANWDSTYTSSRNNSANWNSVYSTTQSNSAGWESVETSVRDTSANWNSVYSTTQSNSGGWESVETTVRSLSDAWEESSFISDVAAVSANWNSNYTSSRNNSANWDSVYTSSRNNSANWDSVYSTTQSNSAGWESVETSVRDASANWNSVYNSVYNSVVPTSASWNSVYNSTRNTSGNWDSVYSSVAGVSSSWNDGGGTYTSVSTNSANWNSNYTSTRDNSANWNSVYSTTQGNSAGWESVETTVRSLSDAWEESSFISEVAALSSTWNSNYTSTRDNSANWNSVYGSVAAVSASWNDGGGTYTSVSQNSAKWDSTHTSTRDNSANWNSVYSTTQGNSAGWESVETTVRSLSDTWEESAEILPTVTNYLSTNEVRTLSNTITNGISAGGVILSPKFGTLVKNSEYPTLSSTLRQNYDYFNSEATFALPGGLILKGQSPTYDTSVRNLPNLGVYGLHIQNVDNMDPGTTFVSDGRAAITHGMTFRAGINNFTGGSDHTHVIWQGAPFNATQGWQMTMGGNTSSVYGYTLPSGYTNRFLVHTLPQFQISTTITADNNGFVDTNDALLLTNTDRLTGVLIGVNSTANTNYSLINLGEVVTLAFNPGVAGIVAASYNAQCTQVSANPTLSTFRFDLFIGNQSNWVPAQKIRQTVSLNSRANGGNPGVSLITSQIGTPGTDYVGLTGNYKNISRHVLVRFTNSSVLTGLKSGSPLTLWIPREMPSTSPAGTGFIVPDRPNNTLTSSGTYRYGYFDAYVRAKNGNDLEITIGNLMDSYAFENVTISCSAAGNAGWLLYGGSQDTVHRPTFGTTGFYFERENYRFTSADNFSYLSGGTIKNSVLGSVSESYGNFSYGLGYQGVVVGNFAGNFAGRNNYVYGNNSATIGGESLISNGSNQVVIGLYNQPTSSLFIVGNGTSNTVRRNLFEINTNVITVSTGLNVSNSINVNGNVSIVGAGNGNNSNNWISTYTTTTTNSGYWQPDFALSTVLQYLSSNEITIGALTHLASLSVTDLYSATAGNSAVISDSDDTPGTGANTLHISFLNGVNVSSNLSARDIVYAFNGNSNDWNSVYSTTRTNSAGWESVETQVRSLSDSWEESAFITPLQTASASWDSVYSTTRTNSAGWESVETQVRSLSDSWEESSFISDVAAVSANWNSTYTSVSETSADWDSTYTSVSETSADWDSTYTSVSETSADWDSTYTSVSETSADWDSTYTSVSETSANWDSTYTSVSETSADWDSTYTSVSETSANWDSTYTSVSETSANWDSTYTSVSETSADWDSTYTSVSETSADWDSTYTSVSEISADWDSTYTSVSETSADWDSTYTSVSETSADWDSTYTSVSETSADWDSTYTSVSETSADWDSTYTSVSETSADWDSTYTSVSETSADWDSTYTSVSETSADWDATYDYVNNNSSKWNTTYTTYNTLSSSYIRDIGDNMIGKLTTSQTLSTNFTNADEFVSKRYVDSLVLEFASVSGNFVSSLYYTKTDVDGILIPLQSSRDTVNVLSGDWNNVYTDVSETSANWDATYTDVSNTSANWDQAYSSVTNDIATVSANWDATYTDVSETSADWNNVYTDVSNTSANWDATYTDVSETSADWNNVYTDVSNTSANWNATYTSVSETSANWDATYTDVSNTSANWNATYTSVSETSANWDATYTDVSETSADWDQAYSSVINDIATVSANWDATYTDVSETSADWDSTHTTVNSLSNLRYTLTPYMASMTPAVQMEYSNYITLSANDLGNRLLEGGSLRGMLYLDMTNSNVAKHLRVQATQTTPPDWSDETSTDIIKLSGTNTLKNVRSLVKQFVGAAIDVGGSTKIIFQASDALENDGTSNLPLVSMDYNPANPIHLRIGLDALSTEVLLSYIALSGGFIRVE